jgi:uncharacterized lipoprotein YddW (UPF0748 family)
MRLLLDEDFMWMDRVAADRLVETAKRAGFNVLVPCVWHGRGVTWKSGLPREPRWMDSRAPLADPLGYLIERAHAEGIEVHPWFTLVKRQRDFYGEYAGPGVPDDAFDVHNPEFRRFIKEVVLEVVRTYPIDGVNLDYVRSRGICTSEACEHDYRAKTGRNLAADSLAYRVSTDARKAIESWNARPVEDLVRSVSAAVRAARPGIPVTVSSHAGYLPLRLEGTNSVAWANRGWIDYILHIEYAQRESIRQDVVKRALAELEDTSKLIMIAGNYEFDPANKSRVWSRQPAKVAEVMDYAQTFNPRQRGAALYEYRFVDEAQVSAIRGAWRSDPYPAAERAAD